ncbi:MAG: ribonuclease PH [Spirochaetes bacterium]|nr:ribonuclease PH [Spirochaetota bacterium]
MRTSRKEDQIRKIKIIKNFVENSYSSVLIETGKTKVLCSASVSGDLPQFIKENTNGWLTAEYTMLPCSTLIRKARTTYKPDSRGIEIQRLIGRALRQAVDLTKLPNFSITIDCDVIQADGGTRTTSINGGYMALALAVQRMLKEGLIKDNPLTNKIASISAGIVHGRLLLDLDYNEDSKADVDFNVVMNDKLNLIEVQGTGERNDFSVEEMLNMIKYCQSGIKEIFAEMELALNE